MLREPDLPVAAHDEASRELKLLVDRREDLVKERTAMINRFRWRLHAHRPQPWTRRRRSLDQAKHPHAARRAGSPDLTGIVAELARDELADIDRTHRP